MMTSAQHFTKRINQLRQEKGVLILEIDQLKEQLSIRRKYNYSKLVDAVKVLKHSSACIENVLEDLTISSQGCP